MIMDELTEFASGVALSGAAGTLNIGDTIDLGAAGIDIGVGQPPVYLTILVTTAPTGADTCKFQLVSDSTAAPATDASQTVHYATDDIAIASLPAGTIPLQVPLPLEGQVYERYVGVQQVNVGAGALADLVVDAWLSFDVPKHKTYPDASN